MEYGGKPDSDIGGVRMLERVAQRLLRGLVQQGRAAGRDLNAVVGRLPADAGALATEGDCEPVDAAGEPQP